MKQQLINEFKKKLEGTPVYGIFSKSSDPSVIEIIGLSEFDFVILDMEHGQNDFKSIENLVRAAENSNLAPIIRVAENSPHLIGKALDAGAIGVQIPNVSSKLEAEKAIESAKFYPMGNRGVCRFVRNADYGAIEKSNYFNKSNECIICLQIEGKAGIDSIDEILKLEGWDILFIGPYDLSQSLGIPGDINNDLIWKYVDAISIKVNVLGKTLGIFFDDLNNNQKILKHGIRYLAYSVDTEIFRHSCVSIVKTLKQ